MVLDWVLTGMGAAGAVAGVIAHRGQAPVMIKKKEFWKVVLTAAVSALILFALTYFFKLSFPFGEKLGYGILIGAFTGILAGMCLGQTDKKTPWALLLMAAGLSSLALFGAGLIILLFGAWSQPVLGGFIVGALLPAVLYRLVLPAFAGIELWALSATTVGATLMLATFRFDAAADYFWWRAPLLVLLAALVAQTVGATAAREGKGFAIPAFIASSITLGLVALFTWHLFPNWLLFWVAAVGVGTFALAAWLFSSSPAFLPASATAVLGVMAFAAVGFRLLGGFGIGMGMLAAWPIVISAVASSWLTTPETNEHPEPAHSLILLVFIGTGILFYRLFLEHYAAGLQGLDLYPHYTFIALIFGAVFPFVLLSFFPLPQLPSLGRRLSGALLVGFLALIAPLILLVLWGFKAALGFLIGSVAATVFILFAFTETLGIKKQGWTQAALLVLTAQVSAGEFSGLLSAFAQLPRLTKVIILAVTVVAGLLLTKIWGLLHRPHTFRREKSEYTRD